MKLYGSFIFTIMVALSLLLTQNVFAAKETTLAEIQSKPTITTTATKANTTPIATTTTAPATLPKLSDGSEIGMVTGSPTGTYYHFGNDIKNALKKDGLDILVKQSKGSVDNINRIDSTENAAFGIVQSDVLGFLSRSQEPKSKKLAKNLRMVFPFYQEEVHIITRRDIHTLNDLNEKVVVIGPRGSGSWLTSINLFNITGVRPSQMLRLPPEKALVAVLSGKADAMVFVAGKPVKLFENLKDLANYEEYKNMLEDIHFIAIDDKRLLKEYSASSITSSDYSFVKEPVPTVAVTAILMSYDFSKTGSPYAKTRCDEVRRFSESIARSLPSLKANGHKKWQEVDLEAGVGIWTKDKCSAKYPSTLASSTLEKELLKVVEAK